MLVHLCVNYFCILLFWNLQLLEASVPQLCEYLNSSVTAVPTLQIFLHMAEKQPSLLADHVSAIKQTAQKHPHTVCLAAQVIGAVGKLSQVCFYIYRIFLKISNVFIFTNCSYVSMWKMFTCSISPMVYMHIKIYLIIYMYH